VAPKATCKSSESYLALAFGLYPVAMVVIQLLQIGGVDEKGHCQHFNRMLSKGIVLPNFYCANLGSIAWFKC